MATVNIKSINQNPNKPENLKHSAPQGFRKSLGKQGVFRFSTVHWFRRSSQCKSWLLWWMLRLTKLLSQTLLLVCSSCLNPSPQNMRTPKVQSKVNSSIPYLLAFMANCQQQNQHHETSTEASKNAHATKRRCS